MENREIADLAYIISKFKKNPNQPKPIVFLGAGASISAGIPSANDIAERIIKEFSGKPAINRLSKDDKKDYYQLMSALSADERRSLFSSYINSDDVKINVTHIYLAQLLNEGLIDYIFTPNFDDLLLKACALFNKVPPVYDISNFNDFTTTNFQNGSITYLHGQHHGQWLLNAKGELDKVKEIIPKLFNRVCDKRTWIIIGYSGNDEILDEIAKFESFDNELYWIGYKKNNPSDRVREKLLDVPQKNAFLISGYDSDSFFLQLHSELKLETPEIFNKPFSFIKSMMNKIKDIEDYKSDDEHQEKFEIVKKRLEKSKLMVAEAIHSIENDKENKLEQEIIEAVVKGDFTKANEYYKLALLPENENIKEATSDLFRNWADEICKLAKLNGDKKLFSESIEKYRIADELLPKDDVIQHNWGLTIFYLAKISPEEKLYNESLDKLRLAVKLNPISNYLNSLAVCLMGLATYKKDEKLFEECFINFQNIVSINPENDDGYYNWSSALLNLSHIVKPAQKNKILLLAKEKAEKAHKLNPKNSYNLACSYAMLNDKENALKYLEESLVKSGILKKDVLNDMDWDGLKEDEDFIKLLANY